jgi:hypothetical protein
MKLSCLAFVVAGAFAVHAADLSEFKTVYVLPMSGGLDQFLATRLTAGSAIQVVTDPRKADVVFTDQIGESFEGKLDEMYGQKVKKDDDGKDSKDNTAASGRISSSSRGHGLIFMVDRKTRNVVWSTYVPPRNTTPGEMNHVAAEIVAKLEKDRKGK